MHTASFYESSYGFAEFLCFFTNFPAVFLISPDFSISFEHMDLLYSPVIDADALKIPLIETVDALIYFNPVVPAKTVEF